jgi:hypothetical protein
MHAAAMLPTTANLGDSEKKREEKETRRRETERKKRESYRREK